jgi:hypothetical protein
LLSHSPALLDEVELAVKLGEEDHQEAAGFAVLLKTQLDINKVRLVPEYALDAAACAQIFALEVGALAV